MRDEDSSDETQDTIERLRMRLSELEKTKRESDKKASEYFEKLQRLQADMDNLQKMTKRQIESVTRDASRDLTKRLLPILDALQQAGKFAHDSESLSREEIAVGLDMLYKQLMDVLRVEGLEEVSALGQPLDPEKHEVVNYVERDDASENTVVEEIRKGYLFNGRVLRPAMVVVTRPKTETPPK
jgi:molecular chaperone GrpE